MTDADKLTFDRRLFLRGLTLTSAGLVVPVPTLVVPANDDGPLLALLARRAGRGGMVALSRGTYRVRSDVGLWDRITVELEHGARVEFKLGAAGSMLNTLWWSYAPATIVRAAGGPPGMVTTYRTLEDRVSLACVDVA